MKIRLLLTCMLAMSFGLQTRAQDTESETSGKYPAITFEKTTHNFGLFDKEHGKQVCWFKFTNTGDKELVILSATASCGCTDPEVPEQAIMPGMSDSIKVTYSGATNRPGVFRKTIMLKTNTKEKTAYLYITGEMVEKLVADRVKKQE